MENASFSLKGYYFDKVSLNFENIPNNVSFDIEFTPSGLYSPSKGLFQLSFLFEASVTGHEEKIATISCKGEFQFNNPIKTEEIPSYFYSNSIAILFPYVRAFISTISLQANVKPIIIPTLNLTGLENPLKNSLKIID